MKATKRTKRLVKKQINNERERVIYSYDVKKKHVIARFDKTKKLVIISPAQVKEMVIRLQDLKRFYSYCNADIKLLSRLGCDAQAKKQGLVKNTQYDSRKKLHRLLLQVSMTKLKQKAKTTKHKARSKK